MITKLKKTGNSAAIPLPAAILKLFNLKIGSEFEVTTEKDQLVIRAINGANQPVQKAADEVFEKHFKTFKALADR